jgi:hypothetical protein
VLSAWSTDADCVGDGCTAFIPFVPACFHSFPGYAVGTGF